MNVHRFSIAVMVAAVLLCVSGGAWGAGSADNFFFEIGPGNTRAWNDGGSGYDEGSWYYYPNTFWWNTWFYNGPLDETRQKVITGWVSVVGTDPTNNVTVVVNWSTPLWPPDGPPPLPPLDPEDEADFIVRSAAIIDTESISTEVPIGEFIYLEIPDYNPEWVSIDVQGENVFIEGEIYHVCLPTGEPGTQYGVNFTVEKGAVGLPATAVNTDPDNENDVYIGGGGTNLKRLDGPDVALLGLVPDDDIDAISYGDPNVWVDFLEVDEQPLIWHFSVDKNALGVPLTDVDDEVTTGTQSIAVPVNPEEALGDYFYLFMGGMNTLVGDEEQLGLAIGGGTPHSTDELNGLDLLAALIDEGETEYFQPGRFYFSLKAGSPSLATYRVHQADILTPDGAGGIKVAGVADGLAVEGDRVTLGIPADNDLDALFVDMAGVPFFSVEQTIPAVADRAANPGDILVPDGFLANLGPPFGRAKDGVPDEYFWASSLGLQTAEDTEYTHEDNLDALDVETAVIDAESEPQPGGGDSHAAVGPDTDGDGLPDSVEDGGGVYVGPLQTGTNHQDTDSDDDGFSDMLEVILGTDPNVLGSNSPFTPVWVDFGSTSTVELGTQTFPTSTMADAVRQVSVGGTLKITDASGTNNTLETPTITKAMRIEAVAGPIVIGQ